MLEKCDKPGLAFGGHAAFAKCKMQEHIFLCVCLSLVLQFSLVVVFSFFCSFSSFCVISCFRCFHLLFTFLFVFVIC